MKNLCFTILIGVACACLAWPIQASIITMDLNGTFSGDHPQSNVSPWLTAQFDDHGSSGSVTVTLTASNLMGSEFVSDWYLNLDPTFTVAQLASLTLTPSVITGAFTLPTVTAGVNAYQADGDGNFDIKVAFATANQDSKRYGVGESCQIVVSGIPSLTAGSFSFKSNPPVTGYLTAAHVQSIYVDGITTTSGWVAPVPEPGTLVLAVLGIAGMIMFYRRRS